jgi:DNA-binding CsgD family transcriptional regulator
LDDLVARDAGELLAMLLAAAPAELDATAEAAFARIGFISATLVHVGQRNGVLNPRPNRSDSLPSEWMSRYVKKGLARHDVVAPMILRASGPFTWSEAAALQPGGEGAIFFNEARNHCAPEMLICPVAGRDGEVMCVALGMPRPRPLPRSERAVAHILACLYASLALGGPQPSPPPPDAPTVQSLSKRELQCVYWAFLGKTDAEIAQILAIAGSTVHHHIEKVKAKLQVRSRVDLARRAAELGLVIEPGLL